MPHGITQCYLPPGRGDIPALTGTRLSDPGEMQGWVDLSAGTGALPAGKIARKHSHTPGHATPRRAIGRSTPDPTWKRPPGRPRAKWTDQLQEFFANCS